MKNAPIAKINAFHQTINFTLKEFQINTPLRIAHFLAQISHKTCDLLYMEEIQSFLGDREKYKDRGLIQLTHKTTYEDCSGTVNLATTIRSIL